MPTDTLSLTFGALADPTRRAMLARLARGAATVNELAEPFDVTLQAVSKHLKVLERAGLVSRGRDGQARPAELRGRPLEDVSTWLQEYREFWEEAFDRLQQHLDRSDSKGATMTHDTPTAETAAERVLSITRRFAASPEVLWRAWTEPEQIAQWWGPRGFTTPLESIVSDPRDGGTFNLTMVDDATGEEHPIVGEYAAVIEFERLLVRSSIPGADVSTLVTFTDLGNGTTEVWVRSTGLPNDEILAAATAGWGSQLGRLAELID
jgi:uncharacterized protein YndB with AHSA1/START domain/DNA-binding transcriptional ArsR family regulator